MNIALREGNLNTVLAEHPVDGHVNLMRENDPVY